MDVEQNCHENMTEEILQMQRGRGGSGSPGARAFPHSIVKQRSACSASHLALKITAGGAPPGPLGASAAQNYKYNCSTSSRDHNLIAVREIDDTNVEAFVEQEGRFFSLFKFGDPVSIEHYSRLLAEKIRGRFGTKIDQILHHRPGEGNHGNEPASSGSRGPSSESKLELGFGWSASCGPAGGEQGVCTSVGASTAALVATSAAASSSASSAGQGHHEHEHQHAAGFLIPPILRDSTRSTQLPDISEEEDEDELDEASDVDDIKHTADDDQHDPEDHMMTIVKNHAGGNLDPHFWPRRPLSSDAEDDGDLELRTQLKRGRSTLQFDDGDEDQDEDDEAEDSMGRLPPLRPEDPTFAPSKWPLPLVRAAPCTRKRIGTVGDAEGEATNDPEEDHDFDHREGLQTGEGETRRTTTLKTQPTLSEIDLRTPQKDRTRGSNNLKQDSNSSYRDMLFQQLQSADRDDMTPKMSERSILLAARNPVDLSDSPCIHNFGLSTDHQPGDAPIAVCARTPFGGYNETSFFEDKKNLVDEQAGGAVPLELRFFKKDEGSRTSRPTHLVEMKNPPGANLLPTSSSASSTATTMATLKRPAPRASNTPEAATPTSGEKRVSYTGAVPTTAGVPSIGAIGNCTATTSTFPPGGASSSSTTTNATCACATAASADLPVVPPKKKRTLKRATTDFTDGLFSDQMLGAEEHAPVQMEVEQTPVWPREDRAASSSPDARVVIVAVSSATSIPKASQLLLSRVCALLNLPAGNMRTYNESEVCLGGATSSPATAGPQDAHCGQHQRSPTSDDPHAGGAAAPPPGPYANVSSLQERLALIDEMRLEYDDKGPRIGPGTELVIFIDDVLASGATYMKTQEALCNRRGLKSENLFAAVLVDLRSENCAVEGSLNHLGIGVESPLSALVELLQKQTAGKPVWKMLTFLLNSLPEKRYGKLCRLLSREKDPRYQKIKHWLIDATIESGLQKVYESRFQLLVGTNDGGSSTGNSKAGGILKRVCTVG